MNFNIPKITKDCDIAVHCPNQNDFIELALFLEDEFDFTATKGFTSGSLWNNNKENTCLHIRPGAYDIPRLLYGPLEWAQEHNSQIYEFKNLIMLDLTKIKGKFTVSVDTYEEFIQLRDYTIANCKKCSLEKSEPWMDGRVYSNTINEYKDNFCMNYNNNTEGLIYYGYCYEAYYIREGYKIYAFSDLISEQDQIKSKPDLSFKKTITMKEVYNEH